MAYEIKSIEFHQKAIEKQEKRRRERLARDVSDVGLSNWASDSMRRFHRKAIKALKLGEEHGFDGPAGEFTVLVDEDGNEVDAKVIDARYGPVWIVSDAEEKRFGRKFVPTGDNSRVQKKLGLHEEKRVKEASRWMGRKGSGGLGGSIYFFPKRKEE